MRSAILSSLLLLAACGRPYNNPPPGGGPIIPPEQTGNAFQIDATLNPLPLPDTSFGINTSDGLAWRVSWIGDAFHHQFTGRVTGPQGSTFSTIRFDNAYPGDTVTPIDPSDFAFDAVTDGNTPQILTFAASAQPLSFDLRIDGRPAIGDVVFWSVGQLSTTDVMPFQLISDNATINSIKSKQAPQFQSKKAAGQTQFSMIPAPAPEAAKADSSAAPQNK